MDTQMIKRRKLFLAWQDDKEEAWLDEMSRSGWNLTRVDLPCVYSFTRGRGEYTYRMDFRPGKDDQLQEYMQIFQDAGWEYVAAVTSWRYWRKPVGSSGSTEIFTDVESRLKKYQRLLGFAGFFLAFLFFMGLNLASHSPLERENLPLWVRAIYTFGMISYAVLIPIYIVAVLQLIRRISHLKKKSI